MQTLYGRLIDLEILGEEWKESIKQELSRTAETNIVLSNRLLNGIPLAYVLNIHMLNRSLEKTLGNEEAIKKDSEKELFGKQTDLDLGELVGYKPNSNLILKAARSISTGVTLATVIYLLAKNVSSNNTPTAPEIIFPAAAFAMGLKIGFGQTRKEYETMLMQRANYLDDRLASLGFKMKIS